MFFGGCNDVWACGIVILLAHAGAGLVQQDWEQQWAYLVDSCVWMRTLDMPTRVGKFHKLDNYVQTPGIDAVVVLVGAEHARFPDPVRFLIRTCRWHSVTHPAVQQYALVGSVAALHTALPEGKSLQTICQGFNVLGVHTTAKPRCGPMTLLRMCQVDHGRNGQQSCS